MKASGVDMTVYKEFTKPVEKVELVVKPIMARLGPVYKGESAKVAALLTKVPAEEVASAMKKQGFFMVENYKVLRDQVDISHQKTIVRGTRFIPHVVEPSFGSDRLLYVVLEYAYGIKDGRVVLGFTRSIAPIQVGVYPLMSKDGLDTSALAVHQMLVKEGLMTEFDETGSIGRRYARADEAGVQLGITIDYDTLKDDTVTIRDRDSWQQVRTPIKDLPELLRNYFQGKINFENLGLLIEVSS
jgi:glycyl-tRNA synthetase